MQEAEAAVFGGLYLLCFLDSLAQSGNLKFSLHLCEFCPELIQVRRRALLPLARFRKFSRKARLQKTSKPENLFQ